MKRAVALALMVGLVLASLGAQVLHDPYDPIYKDFDLWYARGYIRRLPSVRPYPAQLAAALLDEAERNGDTATAERAVAYRADLGLGRLRTSLKAQYMGKNDDMTPLGAGGVDGLFRPESWMAISASFDLWGVTRPVGSEITMPGIYSPYPDMVNDTSNIGSVQLLQNFNSIASFGTEHLYFQAGFNRGSFGPFFDNGLVLGPQAGHAGHFSAAYLGRGWQASIVHLGFAATDQYGQGRFKPDKHMVVHSFDFYLSPDIEIGVFESVVYGDRLDLLYLAPFNFLFQAQGVTGFNDNSYLGLKGSWRVADGMRLMGLVYVDDLGFNDLAKLRLNTKYKLAGQLGVSWAPARSILRIAKVDYTAVMPYMYTHNWDLTKDDFAVGAPPATNYSNYLHMGKPIGTELLPNSDRLSVRTTWALPFGAELRLGGELIHHGNASANSGADYGTRDPIFNNGDYIDDGRDKDGNATFQDTTRFLTQALIETTLRVASGLGIGLRTALGEFRFGADFVLAWGWNRGLVAGDDGMDALFSFNASWRY